MYRPWILLLAVGCFGTRNVEPDWLNDGATEAESDAFWSLVDAERAHLRTGLGWWASLRARISLRSFRRGIQTATAQARAKRAARPRTADTHTTRMTRTASRKEQRS